MKQYRINFVLLIFMMLMAAAGNEWIAFGDTASTGRDIDLPATYSGWVGNDINLSETAANIIKPDSYVYRAYVKDNSRRVDVYLGYYGGLAKSEFAHSPLICYPGNGWEISDEKLVRTEVTGKRLDFKRLLVKKESDSQLVYFSYGGVDLCTPSLAALKMNLSGRFILGKRTDSVLMRFSTKIESGDERSAKALTEEFIRDFYPFIASIFAS